MLGTNFAKSLTRDGSAGPSSKFDHLPKVGKIAAVSTTMAIAKTSVF